MAKVCRCSVEIRLSADIFLEVLASSLRNDHHNFASLKSIFVCINKCSDNGDFALETIIFMIYANNASDINSGADSLKTRALISIISTLQNQIQPFMLYWLLHNSVRSALIISQNIMSCQRKRLYSHQSAVIYRTSVHIILVIYSYKHLWSRSILSLYPSTFISNTFCLCCSLKI